MKLSTILTLLLGISSIGPAWADDILLSDTEILIGGHTDKTYKRTSVHDPSIFMDTITTTTPSYYVIGSHLGFSKTSNLDGSATWAGVGGGENNCSLFANPSGTKVGCDNAYSVQAITKVRNYQGEEVDFPNFDAHAWQYSGYSVKGNQWAPDVVYNPNTGKWLMYMSSNGDNWCASIV